MSIILSCDLDDTIMPNRHLFKNAKEQLVELIQEHSQTTDSQQKILETLSKYDMELVEQKGIDGNRFAESCQKTFEHYASSPSKELSNKAFQIGKLPILSEKEYSEIGTYEEYPVFRKNIFPKTTQNNLLTIGDETIQTKKINGLNLKNQFDNIYIRPKGKKREVLEKLRKNNQQPVVHVGNSLLSDIESAQKAEVESILITNGDWLSERKDTDHIQPTFKAENLAQASTILQQNYL